MHAPAAASRPGVSLLEVLVALAIYLLALIAIGRLITFGADRARDVEQQAQAIQLGQSKLAEVMAGAVPVGAPLANAPFDEDPAWEWSMDSEQGNITGLWTVTIHVSRQRPDGSRLEASLTQMVLDPSLRGGISSSATSSNGSTAASNASGSSGGGGSSMSSGTGTPAASGSRSSSGP
jgi:hypothetical protein